MPFRSSSLVSYRSLFAITGSPPGFLFTTCNIYSNYGVANPGVTLIYLDGNNPICSINASYRC